MKNLLLLLENGNAFSVLKEIVLKCDTRDLYNQMLEIFLLCNIAANCSAL